MSFARRRRRREDDDDATPGNGSPESRGDKYAREHGRRATTGLTGRSGVNDVRFALFGRENGGERAPRRASAQRERSDGFPRALIL